MVYKRKGGDDMSRIRKYIINLTDEELIKLKSIIKNKKSSKTLIRRCQVLIDLDEGHGKYMTNVQSAKSNGICLATVSNIVKDYVDGGVNNVITLKRNPNSDNAKRKLDGRAEAKIIQMACGPVPEGHSRWTLRLLEEKGRIELEVPVSKDTIGRALKKTNFDLTAMTTGASRRRKTQHS